MIFYRSPKDWSVQRKVSRSGNVVSEQNSRLTVERHVSSDIIRRLKIRYRRSEQWFDYVRNVVVNELLTWNFQPRTWWFMESGPRNTRSPSSESFNWIGMTSNPNSGNCCSVVPGEGISILVVKRNDDRSGRVVLKQVFLRSKRFGHVADKVFSAGVVNKGDGKLVLSLHLNTQERPWVMYFWRTTRQFIKIFSSPG